MGVRKKEEKIVGTGIDYRRWDGTERGGSCSCKKVGSGTEKHTIIH